MAEFAALVQRSQGGIGPQDVEVTIFKTLREIGAFAEKPAMSLCSAIMTWSYPSKAPFHGAFPKGFQTSASSAGAKPPIRVPR